MSSHPCSRWVWILRLVYQLFEIVGFVFVGKIWCLQPTLKTWNERDTAFPISGSAFYWNLKCLTKKQMQPKRFILTIRHNCHMLIATIKRRYQLIETLTAFKKSSWNFHYGLSQKCLNVWNWFIQFLLQRSKLNLERANSVETISVPFQSKTSFHLLLTESFN